VRQAVWAAAAVAALASALSAQQQRPQIPHAGYVYPAGGRKGASIEVRVGGQFLDGASAVHISGQGVQAKVTQYVKPLSGAEAQKLRDEIQKLRDKRAASQKPAKAGEPNVVFTATDQKRIDEIREKLEEVQRRQSIPALAEIATLQVTIAPDAAVGPRQLRLDTAGGLTNPIVFCVGELPEFARKPVRVAPAYNVVNGATPANRAAPRPPEPPIEITLPVVVNGQMTPGTADQYRFQAKRGQHIVIAASARELIPYVSDAVPGWFQAALTLRDAQGRELAAADHLGVDLSHHINLQCRVDGNHLLMLSDDEGVICIIDRMHHNIRVVVDKIIEFARPHEKGRNEFPRIDRFFPVSDNTCLCQRHDTVREHLAVNTQVFLIFQEQENGVGNSANSQLEG